MSFASIYIQKNERGQELFQVGMGLNRASAIAAAAAALIILPCFLFVFHYPFGSLLHDGVLSEE